MGEGIDEIGKNPERMDASDAKPKGIELFFSSKERAFFTNAGREITEGILKESFLLYRIDLENCQHSFQILFVPGLPNLLDSTPWQALW